MNFGLILNLDIKLTSGLCPGAMWRFFGHVLGSKTGVNRADHSTVEIVHLKDIFRI